MASRFDLRKPTVLVVDDKRSNQLALEAVLGQDYKVLFANSGREALAWMERSEDIHLILMDIQMPDMDGFEAASRIKKIPKCHDIPIIFVTAVYNEDPFIKRGYEVGGIDYFSKPFDPDILRMKVGIYASFKLKAEALKERERQIRESEELLSVGRKLSSVLESLPVGVLIADVEGRICQTTDEVSRILKTVEPAHSDSYGDILGWWATGGQAIKGPQSPLSRAIHDGETSHSERMQIECFDGSEKTLLSSTSPLRGLDGRIVGAVVLLEDLTEPRKIEKDLVQRVTRLIGLGVEIEESVGPQ